MTAKLPEEAYWTVGQLVDELTAKDALCCDLMKTVMILERRVKDKTSTIAVLQERLKQYKIQHNAGYIIERV